MAPPTAPPMTAAFDLFVDVEESAGEAVGDAELATEVVALPRASSYLM